ncbi:hypothetical protein ABZ896_47725 [Streptomyces sp. NPDC047072]|uniref:VMAP-C domain-containing protein n=1 Tax=Streptomyces sp. NPDC047072 TaxID=3154809 RepID=UPI0033E0FBF0
MGRRFLWFRGRPGKLFVGHRAEPLLAAILADIRRFQSLEDRLDLLHDLGPPLRDTVDQHNRALDHLRAIVRAGRRTGTLPRLKDAVLEVEGDDISAEWFALVVTVVTGARGPLPLGFMLDLVRELRDLPREFGERAVSLYVAERRADGRPVDTGPLPYVLQRLYDARVDGDNPTARRTDLLRFLVLLHEEAVEWGEGDRIGRLLARLPARDTAVREIAAHPATAWTAAAGRQVVIQIRVQEEEPYGPVDDDVRYTRRHYRLRGFYYVGADGAPYEFGGSTDPTELFTGAELECRGKEFLLAWKEPAEVGRGAHRRYEFLLPDSLLGYPAERWPSGSAGVPLSLNCLVVVRSLMRYDDISIHDRWTDRWSALDQDCTPGDALARIGWISPGADSVDNSRYKEWSCPNGKYPPLRLGSRADLEAWLRRHADLACLGLGAPYDPLDELMLGAVRDALFYDGIPVMVWRRDGGDPGLLLEALRDGRPPALLAELPHSVLETRQQRRHDDESVGHNITLLWDDPTLVFPNQFSPMTGMRAAGEGAA